jgi:methionyl-tRNA formyltransferase
VPSLHVTAQRTDLVAAVTQPDRPSGRGHRLTPSPVKRAAQTLGISTLESRSLRDLAAELAGDRFDAFVLASYGRILPQALLDVPRLGALNVHPSLLPAYRGATPIQSALRNGESETGVSIMLMDADMDTGPLVLQERVAIRPGETYGQLHDRLAEIGARLLGAVFERAQTGALQSRPQSGTPSVTRPLRKEDLTIAWDWPAQRILDHVRAFAPTPAARAEVAGEIVKIVGGHLDDGRLVIDELIAPNRGRTSGADYLRRRGLPPGAFSGGSQ